LALNYLAVHRYVYASSSMYYHTIILYHEFYYYNILQHIKKKDFCYHKCLSFAKYEKSNLNIL